MSLSCVCDYDREYEAGDWYYDWASSEDDFEILNTSKRKRCCSCGELIDIGSFCVIHQRVRYPYDLIESRKKLGMGLDDALCDEAKIPMAPHYQCEKCGEMFFNFISLGFECVSPNDDMFSLLEEYKIKYNHNS